MFKHEVHAQDMAFFNGENDDESVASGVAYFHFIDVSGLAEAINRGWLQNKQPCGEDNNNITHSGMV